MVKYAVGLDVSSQKINACMVSIDAIQQVKVVATTVIQNNLKGFSTLDAWVKKHQKQKEISLSFCMEATGIYHENCALFLHKNHYAVAIVLPNKSKKYIQSLGFKTKNDEIDAKGLAMMAVQQNIKHWQPLNGFYYELRGYTRQHQSLTEQKTVFKNQLHAVELGMYKNKVVEKQLAKMISFLEKQIEELEEHIVKKTNTEPSVKSKVENILKIKGVGVLTVATILAETGGFELFENSKQLVSYAGYDVIENSSGLHTGKTKISKKGNSRIRRCLHMPAFSVVKYKQTAFINLYERTLVKHNLKMKSYVAVQKKLLTTIYALWKNNKEFDNDFHAKNIQEKEQELASLHGFEKAEKNSHDNTAMATQGKHPVSVHSVLPLCNVKNNRKLNLVEK